MNMDKDIVHQARLHWIIFVWPLVGLLAVTYIGFNFALFREPSLLLGIFMLLWVGATLITYRFSSLTIKKNQIILKTGFLSRQIMHIPLDKVESIDIRQSIMGTILGFGNIVITGTGGSREVVTYISKPLTCRRYIEQMMHG
jgi:uncharacterized membrane protein YdbT with pleckstrin-like domain